MKIAMIGHKRVPSRDGGIEVVVEELAVRMAEQGHTVTLYNRRQSGMEYSPGVYKGVVIRDVPTFNIKGSDAVVYSLLATITALFGHYDVIHFHAEGPAGMAWISRIFRIPTVVTIHGLDWQRSKWGSLATSYIKHSEKIAARCADEIIVLSRNMGSYFQNEYGRKTRFIRNGIRVGEPVPPEEIRRLGLEGNDYILFLARLVPEKGVHYLLEAFRGIDTDRKLVIAGRLASTDYVNELRQMAAKDKRVIMTDFVQGRLLEELYSNCSLYVLPSDVEGMPLSLLEALSYGAPCLASDIEENGVAPEEYLARFAHGKPDDLGRKLKALLADEPSEERRRAQIAWMREHYSWDSVVDRTQSVYRAAMKKRKNGCREKEKT